MKKKDSPAFEEGDLFGMFEEPAPAPAQEPAKEEVKEDEPIELEFDPSEPPEDMLPKSQEAEKSQVLQEPQASPEPTPSSVPEPIEEPIAEPVAEPIQTPAAELAQIPEPAPEQKPEPKLEPKPDPKPKSKQRQPDIPKEPRRPYEPPKLDVFEFSRNPKFT
jgi:protein TonB